MKSKKSKLSTSLLNALRLNPKSRAASTTNVSAGSSTAADKLLNDDNNNVQVSFFFLLNCILATADCISLAYHLLYY